MKKIMCFFLAVLMMFTVIVPASAAEDVKYLEGVFAADYAEMLFWDEASKSPYIMALSEDLGEVSIYPAEGKLTGVFAGANYDLKTNTLTLDAVTAKGYTLLINGMGKDFKICLKGYNEFGSIISNAAGAGASISIIAAPAKAKADPAELVVNRTKANFGGIIVLADGTASTFNIAEEVLFKAYGNKEMPAVFVDKSTAKASKVIDIDGRTTAKSVKDTYVIDYYDSVEAYDAELDSFYEYDAIFSKDGVKYIAYEESGLLSSKFSLIAVEYDAILDMFVGKAYKDEKAVDPAKEGFTRVYAELVYDEANDVYAGLSEDEYDVDVIEKCRPIFMPSEKETINVCEYKGKLYGFYKPNHDDFAYGITEYDWSVYKLTAHPEFGYVYEDITAELEEEVGKGVFDLEDFTLLQKNVNPKSVEYTDAAIESTFAVNNGGKLIEPYAIKNIKVANHKNGLKVSWSKNNSSSHYRIYRKTEKGSYKAIATIAATQTYYIDRTAKPTETYTYTVKGYNKVGWGALNEKGATETYIETPDFTLKNHASGIKVNWALVGAAKKYTVYRRAAGTSKWTVLGSTTKAYYIDKTVKNGKTYEYAVRAVGENTRSVYEIEKITYVKAPTLKSVTKVSSGLKLTWAKVDGAKEYRVYRKAPNGNWTRIATTKSLTYTDKTAKKGVKYTYAVGTVRGNLVSAKGNYITAKR